MQDNDTERALQEPGLVIAKIISLERLPKSDKLKSCKISTGNSIIQVCMHSPCDSGSMEAACDLFQ